MTTASDGSGGVAWLRTVARRPSLDELWTGLLAGGAALAGSFAYGGPTTDFVAVPVTDWVIAVTPGPIVAVAIQRLGQGSELLALGASVSLSVALLGAAALLGSRLGPRLDRSVGGLLGTYFAVWVAALVVLRAPFAAVVPAVPAAVVIWVLSRTERPAGPRPGRRATIKAGAVVLGFGGLSAVVGLQRSTVETSPLSAIPPAERDAINRRLTDARDRSLDIDGIPSLVSSVGEFYEVDINPINPDLNAADWSLSITGAVDRAVRVDYGELTGRQLEHRHATLRCVGEPLNGHEMDSALWTGVPVDDLLAVAGPSSDCECVMLRAADGYYEEFPLSALKPGLLAFGMNGRLLPRGHGFPVRALVPGHWGEVNVKWLTEIELLEREAYGFWELRGWHGTGPVNPVAKLHAVNRLSGGRLQVGGHAYAGTRGVDRVEVSVDGGDTWDDARLSRALPDADVWRQWAFEWVPTAETPEVVVRAIDGRGATQPGEASPPFPSGPSGWVRRTVRP